MTAFPDLAAVQEAIWDNYDRPRGIAQATQAERILAGAEELGQPEALVKALLHLVSSYEYTAERGRILVPFARVLKIWDTSPEAFDEADTWALHWYFKWASSGMLRTADVPLAAIEQWLEQMRTRYRIAGHSARPVWQAEHLIATHLGDAARAQAALERWWAADRDEMADCDACETADRGNWFASQGEDSAALEAWAPVLAGAETCAEEPHRVLAAALLPLVRQGRLEEASSAHLRGYALTRGSESLTAAIARHIEFCALTGNEARGLEILTERSAGFADTDTEARMAFLAATALLLDRLVVLGRADLAVPGPAGDEWTAGTLAVHARVEALAIAARFDARNGADAVSRRVIARMDASPLVARLPLGVRSVLAQEPTRRPAQGPSAGVSPTDQAEPGESTGAVSEPGEGSPAPSEPDEIDRAVMAAIDRHQAALEADDLRLAREDLLLALATAGERGSDGWKAQAHGRVADLSADLDELSLAIQHALQAASWADLAGEPGFARVRLGGLLMAADRSGEASGVLQHALLDLAELPDAPEEHLVRVHRWLGECEREADEPLAAARHWAIAAGIAQGWDSQGDHAALSYQAGLALRDADRPDDAIPALERAAQLWDELGHPAWRVLALRARAWLEASRNPRLAGELLRAAADELAARLPQAEPELAAELRSELAETWRQHALALTRQSEDGWEGEFPGALEEGYQSTLAALATFDGAESDDPELRLRCQLLAGELVAALGDEAAARRHYAVLVEHEPADEEQASLVEYAEELLADLG